MNDDLHSRRLTKTINPCVRSSNNENSECARLPSVSAIIPTRDRPDDLKDLLLTILNQSCPPTEVIVVDDSLSASTQEMLSSLIPKFESINCWLNYVKANSDGLPSARNLGVHLAKGDVILFLDDDTLLDSNLIFALVTFLMENLSALGVQPKVSASGKVSAGSIGNFEAALFKAAMLGYHETDKQAVRRSGLTVFPKNLTKIIQVQRLSGCCFCFRRAVFSKFRFDTVLKRSGSMEDLDFSYRVYKLHPHSLYVTPYSKVIHKTSDKARLPTKIGVYMSTTYWFYVFFKDAFEGSLVNLIAFLWALKGSLVSNISGLIFKKKPKSERWRVIFLINSYFFAFKHLREIKRRNLDFFNKQLLE